MSYVYRYHKFINTIEKIENVKTIENRMRFLQQLRVLIMQPFIIWYVKNASAQRALTPPPPPSAFMRSYIQKVLESNF